MTKATANIIRKPVVLKCLKKHIDMLNNTTNVAHKGRG
jgi:hypothetical protein